MKTSHIRRAETGAETDAEQTVVCPKDWSEPGNTKHDNHMQFHDIFCLQEKNCMWTMRITATTTTTTTTTITTTTQTQQIKALEAGENYQRELTAIAPSRDSNNPRKE